MSDAYDLVVIGSGPAGEKGAAAAAFFGKKVALIERGPLGGTCAHTGTIPSKSLRESALHLSGMRQRGIGGLLAPPAPGSLSIASLTAHQRAVCGTEEERVRRTLDSHGVAVLQGRGEILAPDRVRVTGPDGARELTARFVLVATGSRPHRPPHILFDHKEIYDSDEILDLDFVPKSLLVYGAGVIGCEYASMFAALGVDVTLVEPRDALLPFLDPEVRESLIEAFKAAGIKLLFGKKLDDALVIGHDRVKVLMGDMEIEVEKFLFAAGRTGNTGGIGLDSVGVKTDARGFIPVNEVYRSSCPTVYAAGDVIGFPALASTSMDQGRIAVGHAFGIGDKSGIAHQFPYGIYTIPEVSTIGDTEETAKKRGEDVEVGRAWLTDNARGRINGGREGMLKIVFRASDRRLLGVHVIGEQAAELVHIGMTVMQFGGTIQTFIDAVYNYPTLSEAYKYAAYDGLGRLAKRKVI